MESKKTNIPKRRFMGFTDTWEQRKLSDVVDSVDTGKSKFDKEGSSGEYPILGSTSVIGYDDEYDYEGDFILTARVGANAGSLYRHAGKVKISDNTVFIQTSQNIEFLYQLLIRFDIKKLSFGTGQPLVKASELKSLELMMPTDMREQMRIGVYFKNLDNLITLHQRKLDKLKDMKKSYLSEMFPQAGEKKPRRRFKGITEDWEQRKLGEVCSEIGDGLHSAPEYDDNGKFFFINGNNLNNGQIIVDSNETKRISKETFENNNKHLDNNTVLLSINGTIGNLAYYQGEQVMLGKSVAYLKANEIDKTFLYTSLQTATILNNFMLSLTGTTIKNLGLEAIKNTIITIPKLKEQEKIGAYFSNLDHLITLHQRKLDKLKNLKQAYLNEMFV